VSRNDTTNAIILDEIKKHFTANTVNILTNDFSTDENIVKELFQVIDIKNFILENYKLTNLNSNELKRSLIERKIDWKTFTEEIYNFHLNHVSIVELYEKTLEFLIQIEIIFDISYHQKKKYSNQPIKQYKYFNVLIDLEKKSFRNSIAKLDISIPDIFF
jgi:hypothetical protein